MTHFPALCYLGFGELILTSANSRHPPLLLLSCLPPRHPRSCLVSPPQSCPSHAVRGVGEAPEFTMPRGASGEVCEEPTAPQAAVDTETARVLLNTTSQSHLSHCVKPSSIHPPDKTHSCPPTHPSPSPWSVKFVSPTHPCRSSPLKTPQKDFYFCLFLYIFFVYFVFLRGERIGWGFASPWAFWTTSALLRLQPPQTNPIATVNLIISSPALFMLGSFLRTPCTSSSLGVCDKTLKI